MSTAYTESGRVRQKERTRDHLVQAARRLIDSGDTPSVEEVAETAGISRTTAYRYFQSQAQLMAAAFPETTTESLLPIPASDDVVQRVNIVVTGIVDIIERTEPHQRAMLRLSLGEVPHELPLRQGRAIKWLTEALEPLRGDLGDAGLRSLALALRSVCGIEARVWLRDIGGLESDDIRALQLWMTNALVTRATKEAPPSR